MSIRAGLLTVSAVLCCLTSGCTDRIAIEKALDAPGVETRMLEYEAFVGGNQVGIIKIKEEEIKNSNLVRCTVRYNLKIGAAGINSVITEIYSKDDMARPLRIVLLQNVELPDTELLKKRYNSLTPEQKMIGVRITNDARFEGERVYPRYQKTLLNGERLEETAALPVPRKYLQNLFTTGLIRNVNDLKVGQSVDFSQYEAAENKIKKFRFTYLGETIFEKNPVYEFTVAGEGFSGRARLRKTGKDIGDFVYFEMPFDGKNNLCVRLKNRDYSYGS